MTQDELEKRLLRLESLQVLQTADVSALLALCVEMHKALEQFAPNWPHPNERFLYWRKKLVYHQLKLWEEKDPAKAAAIQEHIDRSSVNYPFDYDED